MGSHSKNNDLKIFHFLILTQYIDAQNIEVMRNCDFGLYQKYIKNWKLSWGQLFLLFKIQFLLVWKIISSRKITFNSHVVGMDTLLQTVKKSILLETLFLDQLYLFTLLFLNFFYTLNPWHQNNFIFWNFHNFDLLS